MPSNVFLQDVHNEYKVDTQAFIPVNGEFNDLVLKLPNIAIHSKSKISVITRGTAIEAKMQDSIERADKPHIIIGRAGKVYTYHEFVVCQAIYIPGENLSDRHPVEGFSVKLYIDDSDADMDAESQTLDGNDTIKVCLGRDVWDSLDVFEEPIIKIGELHYQFATFRPFNKARSRYVLPRCGHSQKATPSMEVVSWDDEDVVAIMKGLSEADYRRIQLRGQRFAVVEAEQRVQADIRRAQAKRPVHKYYVQEAARNPFLPSMWGERMKQQMEY